MENNEINKASPPFEEWWDAWSYYLLRASTEEWKQLLLDQKIRNDDINFAADNLNKLLVLLYRTKNLYPEAYGLIPTDDRMDYDRFRKFLSTDWLRFLATFSGLLSARNPRLRSEIAANIPSVAAVVQKCNYEDFKTGEQRTLDQVIKEKYQRPYRGNFADQPCIARGTAFLISKNVLLTAAHNLANEDGWIDDKNLVYLFDFHKDENGNLPTEKSTKAYYGTRLKYQMKSTDDWMLVKLASEVESHRVPLKLRKNPGHPNKLRGFYSPGFSQGLPMKLTMVGHYVRRLTDHRFAVNLDMFNGNSGSPVISIMDNEVEGLFVAGFPDLVEEVDSETKERFMKLRTFNYGDIARGISGERCQLIDDKLIKRINDVLNNHCLQPIS